MQRWVDGTQPNYGLSLRASASDSLAFKKLTGHSHGQPAEAVRHALARTTRPTRSPSPVPDPPVLQNQAGKVKVTVTNKGAETWTPGTYYLAYRAYNAKTASWSPSSARRNLTGNVAAARRSPSTRPSRRCRRARTCSTSPWCARAARSSPTSRCRPAGSCSRSSTSPPVVKEQYPPNGYQAQTLTPQLWASGVDIDAPPGSALQYKFEICEADKDGKPTGCTNSGYQTTSAYPVPAGRLKWGKTYLWRGFVKDASNEVPTAQIALVRRGPAARDHLAALRGAGQGVRPATSATSPRRPSTPRSPASGRS